ncbi:MAG: response regulator transcription factor [Acidobacteriota bacterium]
MKNLVLIAEDDRRTAEIVALYLEREGFQVELARDGKQALELFKRLQPTFVILDLMLPRINGWEVCRTMRRRSTAPILILSAKDEEFHRVLGLSIGADDYMVKPFSPRELVARVKAILRRSNARVENHPVLLSHRNLVLDVEKRKLTINGQLISLTPSEYRLLEALMLVPGRVFLREELLSRLYSQTEAVIDRVVDVHIGNLRRKIENDPAHPEYILTVRGLGYRFAEE